jgi:hypothetical protein
MHDCNTIEQKWFGVKFKIDSVTTRPGPTILGDLGTAAEPCTMEISTFQNPFPLPIGLVAQLVVGMNSSICSGNRLNMYLST